MSILIRTPFTKVTFAAGYTLLLCDSGFTNHFGPSTFLPVISLCFIAASTHTTEDGLEPFHAIGTSRCEYQGSGPLARSACSETYGSFSFLNL
jgi:hypothetical protein